MMISKMPCHSRMRDACGYTVSVFVCVRENQLTWWAPDIAFGLNLEHAYTDDLFYEGPKSKKRETSELEARARAGEQKPCHFFNTLMLPIIAPSTSCL